MSNSGSISGGNCGELLLTSYSRDVHQLLAELFTAAGAAGIASGSCGRSCFPLPSRPGKSCFPLPSRPGRSCFPLPSRAGRSCFPRPSRPGRSCFPLPSRPGRSCFPLPAGAGRSCFPRPSRPGRSCFPRPSRPGRSCFPRPSRPGRSCFPRPSRSPQPFRALDRTCSAQLLALPLRVSIGSSRLFRLSPWLPAAFSQGSFLHNHDQPCPRNLRGLVPSSTAARRRASSVPRFASLLGGGYQVAPCWRSAVARAAGPRPQPEPLARLPPTPGRARVTCFAGGREWGGQPPRYRSPPPGPDAAYLCRNY